MMAAKASAMACSKAATETSLGRTEELLYLRPSLFDGVEVGRIGRQADQAGTGGSDEFPHPSHFVRRQIVHDHHLSGMQTRAQPLFQISQEDIPVGGRFNRHGGLQAARGQRGQHRHGMPMTVWEWLLAPALPAPPGHSCGSSAWWRRSRPERPTAPGPPDLSLSTTLAGGAALPACLVLGHGVTFLSRSPICRKANHSRPMLSPRPWVCCSCCCNSIRVRSGCLRICSRIQSSTATVTRLTGPRRHGGRSICPVRVRRAEIFLPSLHLPQSAPRAAPASLSSSHRPAKTYAANHPSTLVPCRGAENRHL